MQTNIFHSRKSTKLYRLIQPNEIFRIVDKNVHFFSISAQYVRIDPIGYPDLNEPLM